uniref:folate gamma-glutamyl hydrolase n=1 Tax=Micromonas pusilla TaxID=38833 RepID=A0A7S0KL14_MICPS
MGSPREATRNVMFRVVSASAMILALVLAAFIAPGSCARPVPAGHHAATHRVASPTQRQQETRGDDPRPLVGVLSQPRYWTGAPDAPGGYIAASYVKWLEAAGARAVPILYTDSNITIQRKLSAVNGVLLPGGDSDISPGTSLRAAGESVVRESMAAASSGEVYPVWGTCMGFQLLALAVSQNDAIFGDFDGPDMTSKLRLTEAAKSSRMLASIPPDVLARMTTSPGAIYENHAHGFAPGDWKKDARLLETFGEPVALDVDRGDRPFVALVEGRAGRVNVYGAQFHPEKPLGEWNPRLAIPHDEGAVRVAQSLANFFVGEARRSPRRPELGGYTEDDLVMANYQTTFVGKGGYVDTHFDEIYVF